MMDVDPGLDPGTSTNQERRPRPSRRDLISIPSLARRGRATFRQFVLLLAGGYIAVVEARRQKTGGRGLLFRSQAALAWAFRIFVDSEYADLPFPVQLRRRLEELGPTYVKLGQILSLRSDILPPSVTQELQNLLSRLPEVDFEEIRSIIEADLGRPLAEMFTEVDPKPLASASIAQIHKAETLEGEETFSDWHTFYIRSVDDQLTRSAPDKRYFNSHTIAPTSRIERPEPVDNASWAATLRFSWLGEDLDAESADKLPAYFEIKHVRDAEVTDPTNQVQVERLFNAGRNELLAPLESDYPTDSLSIYYDEAERTWLRLPGDVAEYTVSGMNPGASYGFAVRSIEWH